MKVETVECNEFSCDGEGAYVCLKYVDIVTITVVSTEFVMTLPLSSASSSQLGGDIMTYRETFLWSKLHFLWAMCPVYSPMYLNVCIYKTKIFTHLITRFTYLTL